MNSLLALLLPLLLASSEAPAPLPLGAVLPAIRGELLDGRACELPAAVKGKVTLVVLGFTRGSSEDVKAWGARFKAAYGADTTLTWMKIPVMGGMARVMKGVITGAMRGETPEADRAHLMTVWSGGDEWRRRMGYQQPKPAYVVLLDREGRVRWRGVGPLDDEKWKLLVEATEAAR